MKSIVFLLSATLLTIGHTAPTWARPALPSVASANVCSHGVCAVQKTQEGGFVLRATITRIDYNTGWVDLETEVGKLQALVSPEEIQDLREGDTLIVYIAEDEEPRPVLT